MGDVRTTRLDDLPAVGATLARAFHDDPVTTVLFPPRLARRHDRLADFMAMGAEGGHRHDSVWVTPGLEAAAVWRPPGKWKLEPREMIRQTPRLVRALGRRTLTGLGMLNAIEAGHPSEPHWYLEILGTDPRFQGRGFGVAVMQPVLDRCDEEGLGAYLESSKQSNIAYYGRHGFEVTEEVALPAGPTVWRMWRDPRP